MGFQCIPEPCPFCLAQWGARWRLCSSKTSPCSCVRSDPSLKCEVVGQGPAFVQCCILLAIVRRPQPFRDFKGSFAQFLLSETLSTKKQQCRGVGGTLFPNIYIKKTFFFSFFFALGIHTFLMAPRHMS